MKLIGPSSAFAPMPTGHPLGLPGQMSVKDNQTRVVEPAKSSSTNLATHLGLPHGTPQSSRRDAGDSQSKPVERDDRQAITPSTGQTDEQPAPPTILQLKINEILQAQAEAKLEEARTKPAPQPEPLPEPEAPQTEPVQAAAAEPEEAPAETVAPSQAPSQAQDPSQVRSPEKTAKVEPASAATPPDPASQQVTPPQERPPAEAERPA